MPSKYDPEKRRQRYLQNKKQENDANNRRHFVRKYGITIEQRDDMVRSQNGRCAICETDTPDGQGWHVDHCHTSGKVRGILCCRCNAMLGYALDNKQTLSNAIKYLS